MSENKLTLLETVEKYLGTPLPSFDAEILESCKEEVKFIRNMSPINNLDTRLNICYGQLIVTMYKDKSITTTYYEKSKGNQYRRVLKGVDLKKVKKVVVVNNIDKTKRTGSGLWFWEF